MIGPMEPTRILAIRHGETAWNVDTRVQGHLDIPLNATGRDQARRLARVLAGREPVEAIYSSDLSRALATARAVAETTGASLETRTGLRERCFGALQGRKFTEVSAAIRHWPSAGAAASRRGHRRATVASRCCDSASAC